MRKLLLFALLLFPAIFVCCQTEIDSLVKELNQHPQQDTVRYFLLKKISFQYSFTNPNKGVEAADAAIELAKRLNSNIKLAGAYSNKATNFHKLGRDSEALSLYTIAANLHLSEDYKKGAANAYFNMSYVYFDIGNYVMAINYELKSLDLYKELNLPADEADVYNNVANSYMRMDDYVSALKNFFRALDIYQQLDMQESKALVLSNIGMAYHELADSAKAYMYYQQALKIDEQSGNKKNLAHDYQHIGVLYDDAKKYSKALSYYQKALALNKDINDDREIASNMVNMALTYNELKDFSSAYKNINAALNIYKVFTDEYNTAALLNEKGKLFANCSVDFLNEEGINSRDRYSTALNFQQQALIIAQKIKSYSLMAQILEDISNTYEKSGSFSNALNIYKQSVVLRDTIFNDAQKQAIVRLEMQYAFDKKEAAQKALNDKQQALAKQEISKQKLVKNISIITGAILLSAIIISFVFYKKRKDAETKKKDAEFNAEVTETEMKALRAQMNPHFIFNSLNSIADYIDKNETQTASEFTAKFAKLMRMVLENSEQKEISLSEDLKALELYMQLEKFRLKNKFYYHIRVAENIDQHNTLIPPLILQPFVENSIWHGIANKDGDGEINISIYKKDGMINCVVEDNGEGMKALKDVAHEKKSLGMKITKARIDILNKIKNANASVSIKNKEQGVRAEVKLPLELSF